MDATPEQLESRWLSEDGKIRLKAAIETAKRGEEWSCLLKDFSFVDADDKDLRGADLHGSDLTGINLRGADLRGSNLQLAHLRGADLQESHLHGAYLRGADLQSAHLSGAHLYGTYLYGTTLQEANLQGAHLQGAHLHGANLCRANLQGAHLNRADLRGAHLQGSILLGADLQGTNLNRADLQRANLRGACLCGANLTLASLEYAELPGTDLTGCLLVKTNLKGANISGARVFGVSAWGLELDDNTKQENLIITDKNEPVITVDNLEVAQFVFLLLNNDKVRNILDTIASKVVLILGRFTPERKVVLNAIREELRRRNYTPVLFDFEKTSSRNITETVSTLAHMARFVIADITDAKSIPQELMRIIPSLPSVAVQPLIQNGQVEYGMFDDFRDYPWVLPTHIYDAQVDLIANIGYAIIAPAETKSRDQQQSRQQRQSPS